MQSNLIRDRRAPQSSRGVSFIEFVGCLAAMGGGLVLGSIYLGLDVKAMAVGILEKADIEVPAILSAGAPINEDSRADETSTEQNSPTTSFETTTDEITTDNQIGAPAPQPEKKAATDGESETATSVRKQLTDADRQHATRACWLALDQSVHAESTNRSKTIDDTQSWHLFDYLLHRHAGHQKVVERIEQLDQQGVDQRLWMHVQQLLAWHETGARLYDRASQLLTDSPAGKLAGPLAQSWQSASTQHRMEEKLLLAKHAAIASYLEHSHKLPAPTELGNQQ